MVALFIEVQASRSMICEFAVVCQSTEGLSDVVPFFSWVRFATKQVKSPNCHSRGLGLGLRRGSEKRNMTQKSMRATGAITKAVISPLYAYIHTHAHVSHLEHMLGFACLCSGWVVSSANYESNKSFSAHPSGTLESFCWLVSPNGCWYHPMVSPNGM